MPLNISPAVKNAFQKNIPVVALESSLLCQGMPYPQNVQAMLQVEQIIREQGCVPATIAIKKGELLIGLSGEEILYFGQRGLDCVKVSRRDLSFVISQKLDGATTVASTMFLAQKAGIQVFATGGIGGVHRGASETQDISADLVELSMTPVVVVSAGAKAVLDLPKTLEYLETKGVPVVGYRTREFPAFYSATSGHPLTMWVESAREIAELFHTQMRVGLRQGIVVANPIPKEFEIPKERIDRYLEEAFVEVNEKKILGKNITPYLLRRMSELSQGETLTANIKLLENNAWLASDIAKNLISDL